MDKVSIHVTVLYRHASLEYDGISSTAEEPEVIKEYLFAINDDVTQDHDSVLHIKKLTAAYLKDEVGIQIKKMHEFTDTVSVIYHAPSNTWVMLYRETSSQHHMQRVSKTLQDPTSSRKPHQRFSDTMPPSKMLKIFVLSGKLISQSLRLLLFPPERNQLI